MPRPFFAVDAFAAGGGIGLYGFFLPLSSSSPQIKTIRPHVRILWPFEPYDKRRFSEAKLTEIVFHAIHDQIEVVLHLDKVLCFIDSLPQQNRKVFSCEAQMTRLEDEIQRYKKLELGLYENFVEGIINKAEYTDFRENYRGLIEEKQEAVKRLKREQQDAAAMGSQNRARVQVFAQYENVQELDRRLLRGGVFLALFWRARRAEYERRVNFCPKPKFFEIGG